MPKYAIDNDPGADGFIIEVSGLPAGTNATISVSAFNSLGTGPVTALPLTTPPATVVIPGAPTVKADDATAQAVPPQTPAAGGESS